MKKILLVSMLCNVTDLLKKAEPELAGKTVTYIPTAAIAEAAGAEGWEECMKEMTEAQTRMLEELGLKVEELEISKAPLEQIQASLTRNDLIFVGGGNTFFLLQELKRSGADRILVREVEKGKLYIGESAGAVAAAPVIGYCAQMDEPWKAPDLTDYSGLNLVDFYVVPHLDHPEMGTAAQEIIEKYGNRMELKVINDEQAIFVENGQAALL